MCCRSLSIAGAGRRHCHLADIAAGNAENLGTPLTTELKILILHGLLHLAGYDHESDDGEMTARESQLRRELGLPLGLIERTNATSSPDNESQRPRASPRNGSTARCRSVETADRKRGGSRA